MDPRRAWRAKYQTAPEPWRGPVHAEPLLRGLVGPRIVELGAGGGKVGAALPPGAVALDWIPQALCAAAPRPRIVADARALPLRAASVNALVAIHVLGHLLAEDRRRALAEWSRVARPCGALVVEVFARGDAREGAGRLIEEGTWEREGITTHYFTVDELSRSIAGWAGEIAQEERAFRWGTRRVLRARLVREPAGSRWLAHAGGTISTRGPPVPQRDDESSRRRDGLRP